MEPSRPTPTGLGFGVPRGCRALQSCPLSTPRCQGDGKEETGSWLSGTIVFMADDRVTDSGARRGRPGPNPAAPPQRYEIISRNRTGGGSGTTPNIPPLPCPAENGGVGGAPPWAPCLSCSWKARRRRVGGTAPGRHGTAATGRALKLPRLKRPHERQHGPGAAGGVKGVGCGGGWAAGPGWASPEAPCSAAGWCPPPRLPPGGTAPQPRALGAAHNTTTKHAHTQPARHRRRVPWPGGPQQGLLPQFGGPLLSPGGVRGALGAPRSAHSRTRLGLRSCL